MDEEVIEPPPIQCRQCYCPFYSRNRLFAHIREANHYVEDGAGPLDDAPWRSWSRFNDLEEGFTTDLETLSNDLRVTRPQLYIVGLQLRGKTSWMEWKHEFVVIKCLFCPLGAIDEDSCREFYIQLDRAWDAPVGWREYVPSGWAHTAEGLMSYIPTINSAKPASGGVQILIHRSEDKGTTCIASIERKVNVEALVCNDPRFHRSNYFLGSAASLFQRIGQYALLGANCWSYSRTVLALAFYQMATEHHELLNISLNGRPSNYAAFREVYGIDPWTLESTRVWHKEASHTHSWPNPEHYPSWFHRIALIASSLLHSSRKMLHIGSSGMVWQWVPVEMQIGNIMGVVHSVHPFNIGTSSLRLDPAFGNPPLWVDQQYENLLYGKDDVDQKIQGLSLRPEEPPHGPVVIFVSDPICFKALFSVNISLPLTLPINDPPPSTLSVAIVRELCGDPKTWVRPEGSRMYVDSRQCSNTTNAQPTDPLRVVLLKRHAIPFDAPMFQVVETFPSDDEPPSTNHDIRGMWKLDPAFFMDGILPGDRISIWLEPGPEGLEVGSVRELSILSAVATWQKLPVPRLPET